MSTTDRRVLLVGASRGLGLALAEEWVGRHWHVTGTVRGHSRTGLHDLAERQPGQVEVETLDITVPEQIAALAQRLDGRRVDLLYVSAGVVNQPETTVAEAPTEEFVRVLVTNTLSPMRVVESLAHLVELTGTIAVMSSGQGSVSNNTKGGHEVYRASKAALNTSMRSYDARVRDDGRTRVLMAPGWIRTDLGGPDAPLSIADSIPRVVDTLDSLSGARGLHYVDYQGATVPW